MEAAGEKTILQVLQIVAGKAPIPHGVEHIAQDVTIHMNGHTFRGINTWANWISYIRTRGRVSDLEVEVGDLVTHEDGTITARGRWKAQCRGKEVFSKEISARYRVVDGIIAEIWTTRTNYAFMVGPMMYCCAGHLAVMLHVFFWAKMFGVPDLRTSASVDAVPTLSPCEEPAGA